MKLFVQGHRHIKFFHSYVQGKRKKLHLSKISNEQGQTLMEESQIWGRRIKSISGAIQRGRKQS